MPTIGKWFNYESRKIKGFTVKEFHKETNEEIIEAIREFLREWRREGEKTR